MQTLIKTRAEVITNCINKYFKTEPLIEGLDKNGHLCYANNDLIVYDCLFTIRYVKDGFLWECSNVNKPSVLCKESEMSYAN